MVAINIRVEILIIGGISDATVNPLPISFPFSLPIPLEFEGTLCEILARSRNAATYILRTNFTRFLKDCEKYSPP